MNRKRILVVDDEIGFTRLLKLTLEQTNNYAVRVENQPERAVTTAREFQPDLILLDMVMPRRFGGDVAAGLRADANLTATPIVFFTATVSRTSLKKHDGMISGFPFLAKPSSVEEIIQQIEQHLNRGSPMRRVPSIQSCASPSAAAATGISSRSETIDRYELRYRNAHPLHKRTNL